MHNSFTLLLAPLPCHGCALLLSWPLLQGQAALEACNLKDSHALRRLSCLHAADLRSVAAAAAQLTAGVHQLDRGGLTHRERLQSGIAQLGSELLATSAYMPGAGRPQLK